MKLEVKISTLNHYPLRGFFIKGTLPQHWLIELQSLNFNLKQVELYPIPDNSANSIWGCLVLANETLTSKDVGKHELSQAVFPNFYIPEKTNLNTNISKNDRTQLFPDEGSGIHTYHPAIGFAHLEKALNWQNLLALPKEKYRYIFQPAKRVFIPSKIKSYQLKAVEPEAVINNLEHNVFPEKKPMPDEKLNLYEKLKFAVYKLLFKQEKNGQQTGIKQKTKPTFFLKLLDRLSESLFPKKLDDWATKMQKDFEELSQRNKKEVDKLLDMLKANPEEALKYAIPLDNNATFSGDMGGNYTMQKIWNNFSLFTGNRTSSGSGLASSEYYYQLRQQYENTAQNLIESDQYEKAAFIYLKLLKDKYMAANTLEKGEFYEAAAALYLKPSANKFKAAYCYEKGNMFKQAIQLYTELKEFEKAGDLYIKLNQPLLAENFYNKMALIYIKQKNYIKAASILRNKIHDNHKAQETLLQGWELGLAPYKCLKEYLSYIKTDQQIIAEFNSIYANKVNSRNSTSFIKVLKNAFNKNKNIAPDIKLLAYEMIAKETQTTPKFIDHLRAFNLEDKEITKDIMRFRQIEYNS